jgi:hypothetical protein
VYRCEEVGDKNEREKNAPLQASAFYDTGASISWVEDTEGEKFPPEHLMGFRQGGESAALILRS